MEMLATKIKELSDLLKASLMPSLRVPSMAPPKMPKMPSMAPPSTKNPVKVAQQVKDPNAKNFAMKQATSQVKAAKNPMAFSVNKSEGNSYNYHVVGANGQRKTSEPMSMEDVNRKYGGVKELESSGCYLVPVKHEELAYDRSTSQWQLRPKK
jgi:hypothetical protein